MKEYLTNYSKSLRKYRIVAVNMRRDYRQERPIFKNFKLKILIYLFSYNHHIINIDKFLRIISYFIFIRRNINYVQFFIILIIYCQINIRKIYKAPQQLLLLYQINLLFTESVVHIASAIYIQNLLFTYRGDFHFL